MCPEADKQRNKLAGKKLGMLSSENKADKYSGAFLVFHSHNRRYAPWLEVLLSGGTTSQNTSYLQRF